MKNTERIENIERVERSDLSEEVVYITIADFCRLNGLSLAAVTRLAKAGKVPQATQMFSRWVIDETTQSEDITELLEVRAGRDGLRWTIYCSEEQIVEIAEKYGLEYVDPRARARAREEAADKA